MKRTVDVKVCRAGGLSSVHYLVNGLWYGFFDREVDESSPRCVLEHPGQFIPSKYYQQACHDAWNGEYVSVTYEDGKEGLEVCDDGTLLIDGEFKPVI